MKAVTEMPATHTHTLAEEETGMRIGRVLVMVYGYICGGEGGWTVYAVKTNGD